MTEPNPFGAATLSTDAFPRDRRLETWREIFGRNVVNVDIEPIDDAPFHATVTFRQLPRLGIASGRGSASHYRATRELAAKADDVVALWLVRAGQGSASQLGTDFAGGAGSGTLLSATEAWVTSLHTGGRFMTLTFPRQAFAAAAPDMEQAFGRHIPADNQALQLLLAYVDDLSAMDLRGSGLSQTVASHILDLGALAIGTSGEAGAVARARGARAAKLNAIKSDILRSLDRADLSRDRIALRHGITPRHLARLFEEEDSSFSAFVLEQRLAKARRMLTELRHSGFTITDIALACGFGDLSYFNRAFRRAFGATPSDIRHAAARERCC